ncbi:MAG: 30S ribosomal protein S8 [bacterium]|nr:30S ribosomal protein S8 [bacterium]
MTDPIADMLTRVRNAVKVGKSSILVPYSKIKFSIAKILVKNGYLSDIRLTKDGNFQILELIIEYDKQKKSISRLERISKPGRRVYIKTKEIKKVFGGEGIAILSTPKGIMTGYEAHSLGIGGELICKVW